PARDKNVPAPIHRQTDGLITITTTIALGPGVGSGRRKLRNEDVFSTSLTVQVSATQVEGALEITSQHYVAIGIHRHPCAFIFRIAAEILGPTPLRRVGVGTIEVPIRRELG